MLLRNKLGMNVQRDVHCSAQKFRCKHVVSGIMRGSEYGEYDGSEYTSCGLDSENININCLGMCKNSLTSLLSIDFSTVETKDIGYLLLEAAPIVAAFLRMQTEYITRFDTDEFVLSQMNEAIQNTDDYIEKQIGFIQLFDEM